MPAHDYVREIEPEADRTQLRAITLTELVARPPPPWIVRSVLAKQQLGVIFGASGSGKTFFALDLGFAIARNIAWFGHRVKQGAVIYVAGEGHLTLRVRAYLTKHGLNSEDVPLFRVVAHSLNLLGDNANSLVTAIQHSAPVINDVALVVLDTLNSMMGGGDENGSKDMGTMIAAARLIMEAFGCSVIYVHHPGKSESKGARGHSSLKAATDLEIQIVGDVERVAEIVKLRDGDPGQQFPFRLEPVDLGPDPDPEAVAGERLTSCVLRALIAAPALKKPVRRDIALEALREAITEHGEHLAETSTIPGGTRCVRLEQWRTRWVLRTGYDDAKGSSVRTNFDKDRRDLLKRGLISISKPYVWLV